MQSNYRTTSDTQPEVSTVDFIGLFYLISNIGTNVDPISNKKLQYAIEMSICLRSHRHGIINVSPPLQTKKKFNFNHTGLHIPHYFV